MLRSTHFKSSEMIDSTLIPNCEAAARKHMFLNKEMACLGPFSHMHHSFEVDSTQSFMWKCSRPEKVFALLGSKDKAQKMTLGSIVQGVFMSQFLSLKPGSAFTTLTVTRAWYDKGLLGTKLQLSSPSSVFLKRALVNFSELWNH